MKHSAHTHLIFPLLSCFLKVLIVTIKYRFNEKSNISWGNFLEYVKVSFQLVNNSFLVRQSLCNFDDKKNRNRRLIYYSKQYICINIYSFNIILHDELLVRKFYSIKKGITRALVENSKLPPLLCYQTCCTWEFIKIKTKNF